MTPSSNWNLRKCHKAFFQKTAIIHGLFTKKHRWAHAKDPQKAWKINISQSKIYAKHAYGKNNEDYLKWTPKVSQNQTNSIRNVKETPKIGAWSACGPKPGWQGAAPRHPGSGLGSPGGPRMRGLNPGMPKANMHLQAGTVKSWLRGIYIYIYSKIKNILKIKRDAPWFTDHFAYWMKFIRVCFEV